jgi:hypothetical protein
MTFACISKKEHQLNDEQKAHDLAVAFITTELDRELVRLQNDGKPVEDAPQAKMLHKNA